MNTSNQIVCVLRQVGQNFQNVAASGRHDLVDNEPCVIGFFNSFEQRVGPSGSDIVTCYEPVGHVMKGALDITEFQTPARAVSPEAARPRLLVTCVLRLVGRKEEFVSTTGRNDLVPGETLTSGYAFATPVKSGPYGSHTVTVYNFTGPVERSTVPQPHLPSDSPLDTTLIFVTTGLFGTPSAHRATA